MLSSVESIRRIQRWGLKTVENIWERIFEKWESQHTENLLVSREDKTNIVDFEFLLDPIHMKFLHSSAG